MSDRKMPSKGSPEAQEFLRLWASGNHQGKLDLCRLFDISYDRAKHVVSTYKEMTIKPLKLIPDVSWAEQIEIFKNMDRLVALHEYAPSEVHITIETKTPIGIVYTSDWQLGQYGVDYDSFKRDMELLAKDNRLYAEIGGDSYQNIIQPSKMGSSHNQIPITAQRGLFVVTLRELKEKIKVLRTGNHNYWSALAIGEDWERELARRMHLLYMKHYGKVHWHIGEMIYPEVAMHQGRFNSSFNLTHSNKQHQRLDFPDARIIVIEHNHIADVEQYRYNDKECVAIRTGTYAVYDDRAQQYGYFGAHVANPTVILYPNEDRLVAFKNMADAVVYLNGIPEV